MPNFDHSNERRPLSTSYDRRIVFYLAAFYGVASFARLFILTVIPLRALSILDQPSRVSLAYFLAGTLSLCASICLPLMASARSSHAIALYSVTAGIVGLICLTLQNQTLFIIGLALQTASATIVESVISLYALDNLRRPDFSHYEPLRMSFGAAAFVLGPMCGILSEQFHPSAPFILSGFAFAVVGLFAAGARRLKSNKQTYSPNPFRLVPRFFSQPRMRLAYVLAAGRSGWWAMFFIFVPMFVVSHGYSKIAATTVITISMCFLLSVPFWGWVARRVGTRDFLIVGYGLCAIFSALAGFIASPFVAIVCLVLASFGLGALDGVGNSFFLRAVRPLQRAHMTAVFQTFRDVGTALPQLLFSAMLIHSGIESVFAASAAGMFVLAGLSRYLPRKM